MKGEDKFDYIVHRGTYKYRVSEDNLAQGDYYYEFELRLMGGNPIKLCDTQALADCINRHYNATEFMNRKSAKIVATDDPMLLEAGIPHI